MNKVNSTSQPEEPRSTNATLLPEEHNQFYIEQYKQALERNLHWDRLVWTMGTLLMPVSFGVFAAAIYLFDQLTWPIIALLGVVSTFVLAAWLNMFNKMTLLQHAAREQLMEPLEAHFKALNYTVNVERMPVEKLNKFERVAQWGGVRWTVLFLTLLFAVAWILLTVYKCR